MKLMRITAQSDEDLCQHYSRTQGWYNPWHNSNRPVVLIRLEAALLGLIFPQRPSRQLKIEATMSDLIVYLEEKVDFRPQWVCTSHYHLVFEGRDDYGQGIVSVGPPGYFHGEPYPKKARYEITYRVGDRRNGTVRYATDAEQAWQMIEAVLAPLYV